MAVSLGDKDLGLAVIRIGRRPPPIGSCCPAPAPSPTAADVQGGPDWTAEHPRLAGIETRRQAYCVYPYCFACGGQARRPDRGVLGRDQSVGAPEKSRATGQVTSVNVVEFAGEPIGIIGQAASVSMLRRGAVLTASICA